MKALFENIFLVYIWNGLSILLNMRIVKRTLQLTLSAFSWLGQTQWMRVLRHQLYYHVKDAAAGDLWGIIFLQIQKLPEILRPQPSHKQNNGVYGVLKMGISWTKFYLWTSYLHSASIFDHDILVGSWNALP